jgi:hypothetical protein
MPVEERQLAEDERLLRCLETFVRTRQDRETTLPWASRLSAEDCERLRKDLALVLSEPESTGEPVDWSELRDILSEYAGMAGGDELVIPASAARLDLPFTLDIRPRELDSLSTASPAVQRVAGEILRTFLPLHPTVGARLPGGRLKKLGNRDLWQIDLPDGYRLRYYVAEPERMVYVVHLGPHPDGQARGREQTVRARVQRRRHGG